MLGLRVSPATNSRHAAVDRGRRIRHRSNYCYFIVLAATRRGELLLDEPSRDGCGNGDYKCALANFGRDLLQHLTNGLRFHCQQNDIGAFDRFAIVVGHNDA